MSAQEWGNITWKFFHTLAIQINDEQFSEVRDKVINIIITTCNNLPCPYCKDHASNILDKKCYIKNIKTKEHFVEFLRQLHNIVNIKLGKKIFTLEEINDMYINNNIYIIVKQFIAIYSKPSGSPRLMSHTKNKSAYIKTLILNLNSIKYALKRPLNN